jgi:type II secretory pathway component PulL
MYDHEFDDRSPWDESWIESGFDLARSELAFSYKDDFRLLVDRPHSFAVAQSVPFGEKQLGQILENYLEEELPEDIEDFQFDYQVLHSQGQQSAILGFWIRKKLLASWCHFADERSFNSLDIQPAEGVLLPSASSQPTLRIVKDIQGGVRFSSLHLVSGLPHLTLGRLPKVNLPKLKQFLQLQGTHKDSLQLLEIDPELTELMEIQSHLSIPNKADLSPRLPGDPFTPAACNTDGLQLNFRKGEFAQKGLGERLVAPLAIATLALCTWVGGLTYANHQEAKLIAKKTNGLRQTKNQIWKELFPKRRVPKSRMAQQMEGMLKEMNGEGKKSTDEEHISSLQALGMLFSHIEPNDEVLIQRANIGKKSINLSGSASNQDDVYKLSQGFKNNGDFQEPNITSTKGGKEGEPPVYKFRFSTTYTGETK